MEIDIILNINVLKYLQWYKEYKSLCRQFECLKFEFSLIN